jgi:hypothetical protein
MMCEVRKMIVYVISSATFIEEMLMRFSQFVMGGLILDIFQDALSIFQVM